MLYPTKANANRVRASEFALDQAMAPKATLQLICNCAVHSFGGCIHSAASLLPIGESCLTTQCHVASLLRWHGLTVRIIGDRCNGRESDTEWGA